MRFFDVKAIAHLTVQNARSVVHVASKGDTASLNISSTAAILVDTSILILMKPSEIAVSIS